MKSLRKTKIVGTIGPASENKLEELGIRHKLIKPRTPRHNGKVERSHRKDHGIY